ncbi:hypothetical protein Ddye_009102 [Dipteronia dyeriana]|uniref:Reverse transcriptase domain-containing protein n=1 Tax=Dipteronia dyeriana TaxID=168575 RepID=A0AAE0CLY4_9ROSI|nr:hypothetical protein Ddye_009102 [Dipteronia dyeriana]
MQYKLIMKKWHQEVYDHFKKQYKNVSWSIPVIKNFDLKRLSEQEKERLEETFSSEEAWEALCSCDGNKVSGLNAEEVIHSWKRESEGGIIVKFDFENAYDSVDFNFLESMMEVLINRSLTSSFTVERGLRQGDSLSPFLFNIAIEGLSYLMRKEANLGFLEGINYGIDGIQVTHLQFADDTSSSSQRWIFLSI